MKQFLINLWRGVTLPLTSCVVMLTGAFAVAMTESHAGRFFAFLVFFGLGHVLAFTRGEFEALPSRDSKGRFKGKGQ